MTLEELQIIISAETAGLRSELRHVQTQLGELDKSAGGVTKGITRAFKGMVTGIVALGIGRVIKDSIMAGMDAVESENLFAVSMGNMADSARAWSEELQRTLGLNAVEIRKNVGMLYNMTTSMGLTQGSAYELSTSLTGLANDMASFYNLSTDEAFQKLRAGITGEAEPLKALGILVDETTIKQAAYRHGVAAVGAELTQQQKVMARYLAIMDQTTNAQGDLARTIDSPANQLRMLTTQLEIIKTNLGKAFLPIAQIVLPLLNSLAQSLATATANFATFMQFLFGTSASTSGAATSTAANVELADSYTAAGTAAKKATKAMAGFDEVNTLSRPDAAAGGAGAGGAGAAVISDVDGSQVDGVLSELHRKMKAFADSTKAFFEPLGKSLDDFKNKIEPFSSAVRKGLSWVWENVLKPMGTWTIQELAPRLVGMLASALSTLGIIAAVSAPALECVWRNFFKPLVDWYASDSIKQIDLIRDGLDKLGIWVGDNAKPIQDITKLFGFLSGAWWTAVAAIMTGGVSLLLNWDSVKKAAGDTWEGVRRAWANTGIWWQANVTGPIGAKTSALWSNIKASAGNTWENIRTKAALKWSEIVVGTTKIWDAWKILAEGRFSGIRDTVVAAFQGIKTRVAAIWDGLVGIIRGAINTIIGGINSFVTAINKMRISVPSVQLPFGQKIEGFSLGLPAIPTIPLLARGGIVDSPTMAMIGERGKEAVVPLENTAFADAIATAVARAVGSIRGQGGEFNLYLEGKQLESTVTRRQSSNARMYGRALQPT